MTAGRPTIEGKPAGTSAQRAQSCTVTLSAQDVEYLRSMGNGNLSAGIRRLIAEQRQQVAEMQS